MPSEAGTYIFSLMVNDGTEDSGSDQVSVIVQEAEPEPPIPSAEAALDTMSISFTANGTDGHLNGEINGVETFELPAGAQLDSLIVTVTRFSVGTDGSSASSMTVEWASNRRDRINFTGGVHVGTSLTAGKNTELFGILMGYVIGSGFSGPGGGKVSIFANGDHASGSLRIDVYGSINFPPIAIAGPDQMATVGDVVRLDGTASSDSEGVLLSYRWSHLLPVTLLRSDTATPEFTALRTGEHSFTLLVSDGELESEPDAVVVIVDETLPDGEPIIVTTPTGTTHELVLVPAGEFSMGSNSGASDEQPVHAVYLDEYYIDKYEVTNEQYQAFVTATGRAQPYYANNKQPQWGRSRTPPQRDSGVLREWRRRHGAEHAARGEASV